MVAPEVAESAKKICEHMAGDKGKKLDDAIIERLRTRPRTLTHGDARGSNIFKPLDGKPKEGTGMGLIDWQMWSAGPMTNEFPQVFLNSFPVETEITGSKFEGLMQGYYDKLCELQPKAKDNWGDMMKRNMETLHFGGSLKAIDEVLATI